ncbi:dihydroneopterin aldolase [Haloferula chungangensis]|uniref:Dihydroneopterin triphosphate 2'-epimerase n=1 Tax=Haloferula chungangensis TaxID=1048331 RepID=A0ABW2L037_9BACT
MNEGVIRISGLKVRTRIGVPDEERADWQDLLVDVEMHPKAAFSKMNDEISATVDYHAVCLEIEELAETGSRHLIETLADEIADLVLSRHSAKAVTVKIRKFILPQTEWVGVELRKSV